MPNTGTWIALGLGVYSTGLSTLVWREQRRQRKRESARGLRVAPRMSMAGGRPVLGVHAYNHEQRPVEVRRAGLVAANGLVMWHGNPYPPQLPARLGDGEGVFIELSDEWLWLIHGSTGQQFVRGAVEDANGSVYKSEPGPPLWHPQEGEDSTPAAPDD